MDAVLFDFGGVLTTSPFEAFARFERERGLPEGFLRTVNATGADHNAWARLERGDLSIDDFAVAFARESAALGHEVDGREVLGLLAGDLRPLMVEAVRRCRERFRTGLLTNNFAMGDDTAPPAHRAVLDHFDAVIESSRVGVRKPDPRFYELACDALDVAPEAAVFLDDLGVNLKPARAMGMTTIKVTDPAVALAELEAVTGLSLLSG
jgi:putative hydrolase of the HAD superfamily